MEKKHIYLIGFMGCGKSTVSNVLSEKLGIPKYEMDEEIVKAAGMPISEIFEKYGETHFRDLETEMVKKTADEAPCVVSCGGGAVLRKENADCMKNAGILIWLSASPETIYERVKHNTGRPILNGHMNVEYIAALMEKREGIYESSCSVKVATDGKTPEEIASEILSLCV